MTSTPDHDPLKRLRVFYSSSILALRMSALTNVLLLGAIALLSYNLHSARAQFETWKPVVIRVDSTGKASPVDLVVADDPATELEVKVFSADYVNNIQSFDPHSLNRDLGLALGCTSDACARQLVAYFQESPDVAKYKQGHVIVQCTVTAVQLLRSGPWETRVEYRLTNLETQQARNWYALLTMENTKRTFHNPFGLLVTGVRISTTVS